MPEPLVSVIVYTARVQTAVVGGVAGQRLAHLERGTHPGGEQEGIALAPCAQPVELPHPQPDTGRRDEERDHQAGQIAPVHPHLGPRFLGLIARLARARAFRLATAAEPRPRAAGRLTGPVAVPETPGAPGDGRACTHSPSLLCVAPDASRGRW